MSPETRKPAQSAGFLVTANERSLLLLLGAALLRSLLLFRSHCSLHGEGVERRSNPPVDWSAAAGCEHPTGSARRQNFFGANCDRLTFSNSNPAGLRSAGRSAPAQRNRQWSPASALDNHIRTLKGVKQTSRSCKGGASNLPTTRCVSASEALS